MKKIARSFLVAFVVVLGTVTFCACGSGKVTWSEWELVTAQTCSSQGIEARTSNKGKIEIRLIAADENAHTWCCWVALTAPTCNEAGVEGRKCLGCGITEPSETEAAGHKYSEWSIIKAATCENAGLQKRLCLGCGSIESEVIPANGHQFEEWTTIKQADCTHSGKEQRKCLSCNEKETRIIPSLGGHDYSEWQITVPAACKQSGIESKICAACNDTITRKIPALGHDFVLSNVAPTCENKGYDLYTCSRCGDSYKKNIVHALGHDWGDWSVLEYPTRDVDGLEGRMCNNCGEPDTKVLPSIVKRLGTAAEEFIAGISVDIAALGNSTTFSFDPANYTQLDVASESTNLNSSGNGSTSLVNGTINLSGFNDQSNAKIKFTVVLTLEGVQCKVIVEVGIGFISAQGGYSWALTQGNYEIL